MREPDVEAEITLRSSGEGGRSTAAASGYRPQHRILHDYWTSGTQNYSNVRALAPGGTAIGTIAFLTPEAYPHCLDVHDILEVSEGARVVGHARILRVLNPVLQRPPSEHLSVPEVEHWSDKSNPLPENWTCVDPASGRRLVAELQREVCAKHVLFQRHVRAVGRSALRDDVLFASLEGDGVVYVVHLTWDRESDPEWPFTTRFESIGHFFRRWPRDELHG